MAEALPGLGIVAAVLGVVITMEAIGGAPEAIGQKVAAALVGTFLGILLCYGVVGPLASRLESLSDAHAQFLQVLRIAIVCVRAGVVAHPGDRVRAAVHSGGGSAELRRHGNLHTARCQNSRSAKRWDGAGNTGRTKMSQPTAPDPIRPRPAMRPQKSTGEAPGKSRTRIS